LATVGESGPRTEQYNPVTDRPAAPGHDIT